MTQTPRELVTRALRFESPERIPRQTWILPYVWQRYPQRVKELVERYPDDITGPPGVNRPSPLVQGDAYTVGRYVDEWGCVFENIHGGVIGQVKSARIGELADWRTFEPPWEILPEDTGAARDRVNRFCAESNKFVVASCCPRPWERLQFLRTTEAAMLDVLMPEEGTRALLAKIQAFYLKELEFWATTDVDALSFMDDWGAQRQLLIPPAIWRDLFRPLYQEYADLAHAHGKFLFMHSDGCISAIYDDLVEIGVDALNSQLFTMDMADLARRAKGRLTFWGEIDRQHVIPSPDPEVARRAVREVARHLYDPRGGIIAQFELTPGGNPECGFAIFDEWERVHAEATKSES